MIRWIFLLVALILAGCGPSFSPSLLSQCDDLMLPSSQGLNGPNPPQVGGVANKTRDRHWRGKILLVSIPLTPMQRSRVHPAMAALEPTLKASSDQEVGTVGFVLQSSVPTRGGPGGLGSLSVTLVDWKGKVNLGQVVIKEWTGQAPEPADFEKAYPELNKKLKELHR
ncbi:hypothetical protein JST97_25310 [bacterium]|nr:hypothetical protein [bacterium]